MGKGGFIALINPTITVVIAMALVILWNFRREHRHVAVLAGGFLVLGIGFAVQYVTGLLALPALKLVSNTMLVLGTCLIIKGTLARYRSSLPLGAVAAICATGLCLFLWFLFVDPNLTARVYIMNFLVGVLILLLGVKLFAAERRRRIDDLLTAFVVLWGAQFFIRTVAVVGYEGPYLDGPEFYATLYWITLTLSVASFFLVFSVLLVAGIAMDLGEELRTESRTDMLSGLLNRRGFEAAIEEAVMQAGRDGVPLSLVLCDLDRFKAVNDTYGHLAGDRAIAAFAACLEDHPFAGAARARIGGEEFAVLLPAANAASARLFAESVRAAYATSFVESLPAGCLSASFGIAELLPGEDRRGFTRRADAALYEAKNAGRDCVRVAPHAGAGGQGMLPATFGA